MHMNTHNEAISVRTAMFRKYGVVKFSEDLTDCRRAWRPVWKRNRGRKIVTLRTHRTGARY